MAQFNSANGSFQDQAKTLFEVNMISDAHGNVMDIMGSFGSTLDIAKGKHPDVSFVHKNGYIQTGLSAGDTIWDGGSPYPWTTWDTGGANTIYVKAATNNAVDRDLPIRITGLNANYETITANVVLNNTNSTTAVAVNEKFLRINDVTVNNGRTNESDITFLYANSSGTQVEVIPAGFGRDMTGVYTVPTGKTAYLLKGVAATTAASTVGFYIRYFDEGFKLQHVAVADNSTYIYDFPIPLPFPEKTDLDIRCIVGSGRISINFDALLVSNP
jgi:hypothetical protein